MTSTRKTLALGAIAVAAGIAATQPAWAQVGRRAAAPTPAPDPVVAPAPIVTLLAAGTSTPLTVTPAATSGPVGTRPPSSQPIPGPVFFN